MDSQAEAAIRSWLMCKVTSIGRWERNEQIAPDLDRDKKLFGRNIACEKRLGLSIQ
jgi:hypothetical protein